MGCDPGSPVAPPGPATPGLADDGAIASTGSDCEPGTLWCTCDASGQCSDPFLACADDRCVIVDEDDTSSGADLDPCSEAAAGFFCGEQLGGEPGTLYACNELGETEQTWSAEHCPNGCTTCRSGTPHYCPGGHTPIGACVQISCGQLAEAAGWNNPACESNDNGACNGEGTATFDCDHCCDL